MYTWACESIFEFRNFYWIWLQAESNCLPHALTLSISNPANAKQVSWPPSIYYEWEFSDKIKKKNALVSGADFPIGKVEHCAHIE